MSSHNDYNNNIAEFLHKSLTSEDWVEEHDDPKLVRFSKVKKSKKHFEDFKKVCDEMFVKIWGEEHEDK